MGLEFSINDKCTRCMACVRVCPVDAIAVTDDEVRIVGDACIECGLCVPSCFHAAIDVTGQIAECRAAIEAGLAVLILPSEAFVFFFPATPEQLMNACYAAGFHDVYVESLGDELVAREYLRIWHERKRRGMVRSTSPVVVDYCRAQLPELLPFLAPVVTPAEALARYLRQVHGETGTLVYAGLGAPASKGTASEIGCCLSFEELETLLVERGAAPGDQAFTLGRVPPERRRHLSLAGGLPRAMLEQESASSKWFSKQRGFDALRAVARAFIEDESSFGFVDALPFEGNLAHPALGPPEDLFWRKSIAELAEPGRAAAPVLEATQVDLRAFFEPLSEDAGRLDDAAVQRVLDQIGTTPEGNPWNCGACGRATCDQFARAVVRGRASMSLCTIYLSTQYQRASDDALYDALTGVYSYRVLESRLEEEVARANRAGTSLAVLFLDLDDFKPVNDQHGHAAGNQILQGVAEILIDAIRTSDVVCRYGGDEFVVILVNPDRDGVGRVAEQMRAGVEALEISTHMGKVGVTLSIGLAYHAGSERSSVTSDTLMSEADASLYVAKAHGGNTVHPAVEGKLVR
ncbi:MAG: diguanylate cyclase [Gemmatimonadota bacterium]